MSNLTQFLMIGQRDQRIIYKITSNIWPSYPMCLEFHMGIKVKLSVWHILSGENKLVSKLMDQDDLSIHNRPIQTN